MSEANVELLLIVDNVDDLGNGSQKIVRKDKHESVLITSRDDLSPILISRGCEQVQVRDMSQESITLLFHSVGQRPSAA